MTNLVSRFIGMAVAVSALAGCTYQGGDIGDPLTRKFHWFSYVAGDDIRANCQPGLPDRYRMVYNGLYEEQLRMYELDSLRRLLVIRVTKPGNLAEIDPSDLAAPYRAHEERVQLDQPTFDRLVASFEQSGMFAPPPVGLELPSHSFFWTAAICRDGRYGLTAWKHPSPGFADLAFAKNLFALDPSPIPVNQARDIPFDVLREDKARRNEIPQFTLKVGQHGLVR